MKYRLALRQFENSYTSVRIIIFLIIFLAAFYRPNLLSGQSNQWGASVEIGTSFQHTKEDSLTKQGFLLPTFGVSANYIKSLGNGFNLKATLGYRNRGGVAKADAETNPTSGTTLGKYRIVSRDHFVTNDIAIRLNAKYWKTWGYLPFLDLGLRNDVYIFSNSKTKSDDVYFKPDSKGTLWYRNRHHKPYVVGLVANTGINYNDWTIGLEYYHQILGSFAIPSNVRANYSQINNRSIQLSLGYRF